MDKKYEKKAANLRYLMEKYPEIFEKYNIREENFNETEIYRLSKFLSLENPDLSEKDRKIYEENEDLKKIYAVVHKNPKTKESEAIMINLDKEGKIPEGEFGVYNLDKNKFRITNEEIKLKLKSALERNAEEYAKDVFDPQKDFDKILENISLESMEKLATMGDSQIDDVAKEILTKDMVNEKNAENGISEEERANIENELKAEKEKDEDKDKDKENDSLVTPEMKRQAALLGYTHIKGAVVAKGRDASNKLENTAINPNAGNVTILRLKDDSVGKSADKYLVFQDNRMVVRGNKDEDIDALLGRQMQNRKDGTLIEPLQIENEEQYLKYDENGMYIALNLKENHDLSIEKLKEYKEKLDELMDKYAEELYKIDEDPLKTHDKQIEGYIELNERFNQENIELARQCGINMDDVKLTNEVAKEKSENIIKEEENENELGQDNIADVAHDLRNSEDDEIEPFEVPGKRRH